MKSFEQLARSAFGAYKKKSAQSFRDLSELTWDDLDEKTREAWLEVAKQIVAEMATVH